MSDKSFLVNPFLIGTGLQHEHVAERLLRAQALTSEVYLHGEPPPTLRQVSAVLHGLADFTLQQHMLSRQVRALGQHQSELGTDWQQAVGIGRLFHGMGDYLDEKAFVQDDTGADPDEPTADSVDAES